jgi:hypothetical protein
LNGFSVWFSSYSHGFCENANLAFEFPSLNKRDTE